VSVNYARRELRVAPLTAHPERFSELAQVRLVLKDGTELTLEVDAVRTAGKNVCMKIDEAVKLDAIDGLRGARIVVPPGERFELPPDEHYYDDLVGLKVCDGEGHAVGTLTGVYPMAGHHDVYEIEAQDGSEYLVAAVDSAVLNVDTAAGVVTVERSALVKQGGHAR
jgi:16S rRNA processing protein RimM